MLEALQNWFGNVTNICYCLLEEVHSVTLLFIHYLEIFFQAGLFTSLTEKRVFSHLYHSDNCSFLCSTFYSKAIKRRYRQSMASSWRLVVGMSEMRKQCMCGKAEPVCDWRLNTEFITHVHFRAGRWAVGHTTELQKHLPEMLTRVWFFLGWCLVLPHGLLPCSTSQGRSAAALLSSLSQPTACSLR